MKKNSIYVIAEIGINHGGNFKLAKKLIFLAKKAGADAAKFQVFEPKTLSRDIKNRKNKKSIKTKIWEKVSLKYNELFQLRKYCNKIKIDFICSVFDKKSLKQVISLNPKFVKIASSDITDSYLMKLIKDSRKKVILSTGMSNKKEIKSALKILGKRIFLLHCVSQYPCEKKNANIKRMITLKNEFKVNVGYSDHTTGTKACFLAIMLGAQMIEKHFTINKKLKGLDHKISADQEDLKSIVEFGKSKNIILGNGHINPGKTETKNKKIFRKGVYYNKNFERGEKISLSKILIGRPETKLKINQIERILNKRIRKNVSKFSEIKMSDFF